MFTKRAVPSAIVAGPRQGSALSNKPTINGCADSTFTAVRDGGLFKRFADSLWAAFRTAAQESLRAASAGIWLILLVGGLQYAARADALAYMSTSTNNFGTVDLNTGAYTQIGNMGQLLVGLGVFNGILYGAGVGSGSYNGLYQVNTATGGLTEIGTGGISYQDFGSTLAGLFAVDYVSNDFILYSVNPSTGATTLIGSTGVSLTGTLNDDIYGLSDNSSTLFFTVQHDLYTLDTTTGAATLVGSLSGTEQIGALVFENGVLYGGENFPFYVETVDTASGLATRVASLTPTTFGNFYGLAPDPLPSSTPEPGTFTLMLICVVSASRRIYSRVIPDRSRVTS